MYAGFHVKCLSFVSFNFNEIFRQILVQIPKWNSMFFKLDVHEIVHRDAIMMKTNKKQLYRLIYFIPSQLYMFRAIF
jgi:hypothetical protein